MCKFSWPIAVRFNQSHRGNFIIVTVDTYGVVGHGEANSQLRFSTQCSYCIHICYMYWLSIVVNYTHRPITIPSVICIDYSSRCSRCQYYVFDNMILCMFHFGYQLYVQSDSLLLVRNWETPSIANVSNSWMYYAPPLIIVPLVRSMPFAALRDCLCGCLRLRVKLLGHLYIMVRSGWTPPEKRLMSRSERVKLLGHF